MKIVLLVNLPINTEHGAAKGREFTAEESDRIEGAAVFMGDAGEEVTALWREYKIKSD